MGYFWRCPKCGSLQTFDDDERPYCNNPDCFYDPYPPEEQ